MIERKPWQKMLDDKMENERLLKQRAPLIVAVAFLGLIFLIMLGPCMAGRC